MDQFGDINEEELDYFTKFEAQSSKKRILNDSEDFEYEEALKASMNQEQLQEYEQYQ